MGVTRNVVRGAKTGVKNYGSNVKKGAQIARHDKKAAAKVGAIGAGGAATGGAAAFIGGKARKKLDPKGYAKTQARRKNKKK